MSEETGSEEEWLEGWSLMGTSRSVSTSFSPGVNAAVVVWVLILHAALCSFFFDETLPFYTKDNRRSSSTRQLILKVT